jgi:hypothetical protein
MLYNKYVIVFGNGLLMSETFKNGIFCIMSLVILVHRLMNIANIRTLTLNGAHLLVHSIYEPASQATHTHKIALLV